MFARVVNHFVEHRAGIGVQREDAVVGENHTDGSIGTGLDDIALEDVVALLRCHLGAVNAGDLDNSANCLDLTNWFGGTAGGLGVFTRSDWAG